LVNDAIASTHSSLSGQRLPFTVPNSTELFSQQPFHSTRLPLDARVPEKIKVKIWNEEFVDFGSLLSNPDQTTCYEINIHSGCDFKQACFKCHGAHRSVNCNFRGAAKKSPND
jgi:hypothetical protein